MKKTEPKTCISFSQKEAGSSEDLLTKLFHRLPATSLLRFQCVSKHWYSLISDPTFRIHHTRFQKILNPTPNALLLQKYHSSSTEFQRVPLKGNKKVPFFDYLEMSNVKIQHSCNGLIVISSSTTDHTRKYFVCNPTTKQFKTLPNLTSDKVEEPVLSLAFDPLKSPHYKVICVQQKDYEHFSMAVYSSEKDSWRILRTTLPLWDAYGNVAFCNGAVHWYGGDDQNLSYFDVDNDILEKMPMPPPFSISWGLYNGPHIIYFGESRDHLLMALAKHLPPSQFDVFEMKSDYSGWSLRYSVNLDPIRRANPSIFQRYYGKVSVLSIIQGDQEEDSMVVMHLDGEAVSFSQCGEEKNKISDIEGRFLSSISAATWNVELVYEWYESHQYFESLACP